MPLGKGCHVTEQPRPKDDWKGWRGVFNAWFFQTYSRKMLEILVFGNYWPTFKRERARRLPHGNEQVLDIGSGSGNFSIPIARRLRQGTVFCLDVSATMNDMLLRVATKHGVRDRINILHADAAATTLPPDSIDWIVSGNCLHEMVRPENAFAEMFRVLKPGGGVFLVDFRDRHGYHEGTHGPYSVAEMQEYLQNAGFARISVEPNRHFVIGIGSKIQPDAGPDSARHAND